MRSTIEQKVFDYITINKLFSVEDKLVLAVSGGADSVCLFRILCSLEKSGLRRENFLVVHVNHNLRGEFSDADEKFVENLAKEYGVCYKGISLDVEEYAKTHKLSIETAARNLRQTHIANAAKEFHASLIATAHHRGDNAETLLHRMIRGCGYLGLAGIWPKKHFSSYDITYIRPLLAIDRSDIVGYLSNLKQAWREDHTNNELVYTRNKIRHRLLPLLNSSCDCDIIAKLDSLSNSARKLQNRISLAVENSLNLIKFDVKRATIAKCEFNKLSPACRVAIVTHILDTIGFSSSRLDSIHIKKILELAQSDEPNSSLQLPQNFELLNEYGDLIFYHKQAPEVIEDTHLAVTGAAKFGHLEFKTRVFEFDQKSFQAYKRNSDSNVEWFDADKVSPKLILRQRRRGDSFVAFGTSKPQRVGKFLTSAKVSRIFRDQVVIVEDAKRIIWVSPIRPCASAKITNKTKQVLEIQRREI